MQNNNVVSVFVALNTICLRSQGFGGYISTVKIPPYSGYFGLGVCERIRIKLNYIYLKRLCWFSSF